MAGRQSPAPLTHNIEVHEGSESPVIGTIWGDQSTWVFAVDDRKYS